MHNGYVLNEVITEEMLDTTNLFMMFQEEGFSLSFH